MSFISSPVAYPPTSSPPARESHASEDVGSRRKRRKVSHDDGQQLRQPLKELASNLSIVGKQPVEVSGVKKSAELIGGFLVDDDEDGEEDVDCVPYEQSALDEATKEGTMDEDAPSVSETMPTGRHTDRIVIKTCSGHTTQIRQRTKGAQQSFQQMIASRSSKEANSNAQKAYFGIDIHNLMLEAKNNVVELERQKHADLEMQEAIESVEKVAETCSAAKTMLWTEKYRAKKFTDLVGDERTHRSVLYWLKGWDPIVFPHAPRQKKPRHLYGDAEPTHEKVHRKVLLLTGPPGLGKTTLAHVCARQAGYEVQEINASDERSRDVVKGRIRDMVATENVKTVSHDGPHQTARPVCVVVDEVDGVVTGSGGSGEGGFVKALTELLALDQKNTAALTTKNSMAFVDKTRKKRKGDSFRLLRPLILICNDVYHPSLRLLRQGTLAEIVHVRKPSLTMVVPRLQSIFSTEGLAADMDGIRRLCEVAWGVSSKREDAAASAGSTEGDVRSVLVIGEWVASKFRHHCAPEKTTRMTRRWLEDHVLNDLQHGNSAARSLGRGGSKEIVDRVFQINAGFPSTSLSSVNSNNTNIKHAIHARLREMVDSTGEDERVVTDLFATYPSQPFQDDTLLTKPCAAYDWLYFHDRVAGLVHRDQEWEMAAYLSTPVVAFHSLFASASRPNLTFTSNSNETPAEEPKPFTGPRASFEAHESLKEHTATLTSIQSTLSLPLHRAFRSPQHIATELLPYALRLLNPAVKPVLIGGSDKAVASVRRAAEKEMVARSADALLALGCTFQRARLDFESGVGGSVYRLEPPLDLAGAFGTLGGSTNEKARFAVRQVVADEHARKVRARDAASRAARDGNLRDSAAAEATPAPVAHDGVVEKIKRDFFGRALYSTISSDGSSGQQGKAGSAGRVWVTFNEGYSNAVRKGITLKELLDGL